MAVPFSKTMVQNLSKSLFYSPRITVNCGIFKRGLSDRENKREKESEATGMNEKSSSNENEGVKQHDPFAAFPDDVNPVTGEKGGPRGPEPTRYGDWERKGRCIDF